MTPEQRLAKTFELSRLAKELFLHGLRKRFPDKSEDEIKKIYLKNLPNAATEIIKPSLKNFKQ